MKIKHLLITAQVLAVTALLCLETGALAPAQAQVNEASSDALQNSSRLSRELAEIPTDTANEEVQTEINTLHEQNSPEIKAAASDLLGQMNEEDMGGESDE